jgi:hypothetical protein
VATCQEDGDPEERSASGQIQEDPEPELTYEMHTFQNPQVYSSHDLFAKWVAANVHILYQQLSSLHPLVSVPLVKDTDTNAEEPTSQDMNEIFYL